MKQRIITAIIALAFFLPLVVVGGTPFTIAIFFIATVGLYELLRMRELHLLSVEGVLTWLLLLVLLIPFKWWETIQQNIYLTKMEFIFLIVFLLLIVTVISKNRYTFDLASFSVMSALYVGVGLFCLIEVRTFGLEYVLYALLVIWSTDSGAYFIGRKIGKRKLWPDISPNKTIEGFWGGILSAVMVTLLFQLMIPVQLTNSYLSLIVVTVFASIIGQLGDLVESALKRHYKVKDSGKILPGHGGVLDRFDSLLFVLPLLYFLQVLMLS